MLAILLKVRSIACLKLPCLNHFLIWIENFMNNVMAQQWVLLQDLHQLMSSCAILKTLGWKTALPISNQLFTDVEKFRNYLNKQHKKIKLTSEIEENGSLSFLDITITCDNNKFVTSVYRIQWHFHKFSKFYTRNAQTWVN